MQQTRYLPFGSYRAGSSPNAITSHAYTSQRENMDIGLYYYNARYYAPTLARFISADILIPKSEDPQSLNRYAYTRNNPLKYVDADGHCWGAASFVRSWNIDTPWGTIGGGTNCANIDMALTIVQHPDATPAQKAQAGVYLGGWGFAAVSGATGTGMLVCSAYAPCATIAETVLGIGAKACGDGDCLDEAKNSYEIGEAGAQQVWEFLNDPTLQTEVKVYVGEAGKRANYFARLDGLTSTGIHEVKNVSNLSLSQRFMDQAHTYKLIADSMGIELHYWLVNSAPERVVQWLESQGIIVHTGVPVP